ncbi:MAG: hypothetical protein NDJ89_18945 [Oligoflexia bacterium]|nr:hypothetical protein [Oligoflexia bacterium]
MGDLVEIMGLPLQVVVAFLIELFLVALTIVLILRARAGKSRIASATGWVMLCVTFCWSVVFGCIVALNRLTFRL